MNGLRQALQEYLAVRRALGFKLERAGHLLPDFVEFVERSGASHITTSVALAWAMLPAGATPAWWAARLGVVRCFARYLQGFDPRTEVPPAELLPREVGRIIPYVYTDQDVEALMEATCTLRGPVKRCTYATLIGLLATTGMRVGEAIALDRTALDVEHGVLVIRRGKFGKSREVPLDPTAQAAMCDYAERRDRLLPHPKSPALLLSSAGTRLLYSNVQHAFARLLEISGVGTNAARRPRIHDLRHTFAIKALLSWYRRGLEVEPRMARLSTYLGHVSPASTYWYLTATPELMALIAQRVEQLAGGLS
jgi:integrase